MFPMMKFLRGNGTYCTLFRPLGRAIRMLYPGNVLSYTLLVYEGNELCRRLDKGRVDKSILFKMLSCTENWPRM